MAVIVRVIGMGVNCAHNVIGKQSSWYPYIGYLASRVVGKDPTDWSVRCRFPCDILAELVLERVRLIQSRIDKRNKQDDNWGTGPGQST